MSEKTEQVDMTQSFRFCLNDCFPKIYIYVSKREWQIKSDNVK